MKGALFVAATTLVVAIHAAAAQDPVRPWRSWRTITTPNYRFHFPSELEDWTREAAAHVESIDSTIVSLVGSAPPRPIDVVVDDPFGVSNGYALPFMDAPISVWWATPPDPRSDIGNYYTWGEMLSAHELTHVVHLTRRSRNHFQQALWSVLPANLGPIARKSPRWLFEGYATMLEGRITGTGRPNNVWRPALLRQWAIEGRLPTYGQLSSWDDYAGGEFAYVGGSAFLEWLAHRDGDSSLVHVWRRMSARVVRSFDASFVGVYGDVPSLLYGRHAAELTRDAMAAKAELERAGLVPGELIQHLSWGTGDPAISPNGERLAVNLRSRDRPGRLVVWKTTPEAEDTAATRRRIELQKRDPQDVPDRQFYPRPKQAIRTLEASNGRSYQYPRWLPDNKRILVTRWTIRPDASLLPDLYVWNVENGSLTRLTRGAGLLNADPHPSAPEAVAMQCVRGHCDVARVSLDRGRVATLLAGSAERSFYRPRYSPDGSQVAASASERGRWRIVVANRDGSGLRYVDPDDGANRYDAEWITSDTLVLVSERGGIPNLELLNVVTGQARTLTRVTGAALAPAVNRRDRSIWFLSLHSRGHDVRRLTRGAAMADTVVPITSDRFGFAGARPNVHPAMLGQRAISPSRPYGIGPRHGRWLPGGYYSPDGAGAFVTIYSGDIVGRFDATLTGAYGEPGAPTGGSLRASWRYLRPALELGLADYLHQPSRGRDARVTTDSLDARVFESLVAVAAERRAESWSWRARVGGGAGSVRLTSDTTSHFRGLGFGELTLQFQQSSGARGATERLRGHFTQGRMLGAFQRSMGTVEIALTGRDNIPLEASVTTGKVTGTLQPFELFTVGGVASPIADSSLLSQRFAMAMFPTGIATGRTLVAWRVALPSATWTPFMEGASTADELSLIRKWNRAVGFDIRYTLPPVPVAFAPRIYSSAGIAYTLDEPFRKKVRAFLEMRTEP